MEDEKGRIQIFDTRGNSYLRIPQAPNVRNSTIPINNKKVKQVGIRTRSTICTNRSKKWRHFCASLRTLHTTASGRQDEFFPSLTYKVILLIFARLLSENTEQRM